MAGFKFIEEEPQVGEPQKGAPAVGGFMFAPEEVEKPPVVVEPEVDRESKTMRQTNPWVRYPLLAARGAARAVPGSTDAGAAIEAGLTYFGAKPKDVQSTGPFAERFASARRKQEAIDRAAERSEPAITYGSQVATTLGLPFAGPASRIGSVLEPLVGAGTGRALGLGAVGAGYGAASGFGEGDTFPERVSNAKYGALLGGAGGVAVPAVVGLAGAGANKLVDALSLRGPAREARGQFLSGMESAGRLGGGMSPRQITEAASSGQPVLPIDLGGAAIKQAAKTATHANPEAKDILVGALEKRNLEQQDRLYDFAQNLVGKDLRDPAVTEQIQAAARAVNTPAYATAMARGAGGVWNNTLGRIVNHPWVKQAIPQAVDQANADAIARGLPPIQNPFTADAAGNLTLRLDAHGNPVKPPLEMWDIIKKNIDGRIRGAEATPTNRGDPNTVRLGRSIVGAMTNELDSIVPEYAAARTGAGRYLGEESAYRFGSKFLSLTRSADINAGMAKLNNFTPEELGYAQHSYMSERVQKFMNMAKNRDVGKAAMSPTQKAKDVAILGQEKADELEAYLLRERMMHGALTKLGGSDTLPNTIAAMKHLAGSHSGLVSGAVAGAGEALWEGGLEPKDMAKRVMIGAVGGALLGRRVATSEKAATELAKMLVSDDPAVWQTAIRTVSRNPQALSALRQAGMRVEAALGVNAKELSDRPKRKLLPPPPKLLAPPQKKEKRPARATGGRTGPKPQTAKSLINAVERARKAVQRQTETILATPDEHVVKALSVANKHI